MSSSFFSSDSSRPSSGNAPASLAPTAPWQTYRQQQQQPNQGPAGSTPPAAYSDLLDSDGASDAGLDAADDDDTLDLSLPQDPGVSGSGDNDDPLLPPARERAAQGPRPAVALLGDQPRRDSFLFQQRSRLYSAAVPMSGHEHGGAVNLQTLSTAELYLEAVKGTTPRAAAPRR